MITGRYLDLEPGDVFTVQEGSRAVEVQVLEVGLTRQDTLGRTFPALRGKRLDTGKEGSMMFGAEGRYTWEAAEPSAVADSQLEQEGSEAW